MTRIVLILLLLWSAFPLAAQDSPGSDVLVRQSIKPESGAVIGQHVALYVDVLFRNGMPRPPRVSLPDAPGLQAFRFETQATTIQESIGGEIYVGQRFEFALYPRRGGVFDLPPAAVTLLDRDGAETRMAQGQTLRLDVGVPPGVDPSQPVVATRGLTLTEQWAPRPDGAFKAGDAIVRTITRSAEDVPGLAMRDLAIPAPQGVRAYADPPEIDDHSNRGAITGRRTDRVTYVFERGGQVTLPAVAQPWWDLAARSVKTAQAPGATITVEAPPADADAAATDTRSQDGWLARHRSLLIAGGAFLVILAFAAGFLRHRRRTDVADERAAFVALRRACATSDAAAIYRAFARWRAFLAPAEREAANTTAVRLDAALFSAASAHWEIRDSAEFVRLLAGIRRSRRPRMPECSLPPLNPRSP
ncbi:hypothetical protein GAY33_18200 [Azospirillum brasilense]|uniref:BatD family protein n=1 Tax=Azospirillum argentinense TaxID=2970906 RepID=UPI00190EBE69|nr:BatD family protein [Azospirillum argentinense]MBK3801132.1 hypothetical protein [Azospirillum argentinense]